MQAFIIPVPHQAEEYPQFFTAGIKEWYKLLEHDQYKDIIVTQSSLSGQARRPNNNAPAAIE